MTKKQNHLRLSLAPVSLARAIREEALSFEAYVAWLAEAGFDALDIACPTKYAWFWQDFASQLPSVPALAAEYGLEMGGFYCGNNFAKSAQTDFEAEVATVLAAIDSAAAVGCPLIRLFGGAPAGPKLGGEEGMTSPLGFRRVIEGLERCLPAAEERKVILALENHGCLPGHSWELAALVRRFQSPCLRVAFDVANFVANNVDEVESPLQAYETLRENIAFVHVKDFGPPVLDLTRRVEPCLMGEGEVPLRQLLARFIQDGYRGLFAIEYEAGRRVPEREGVLHNVRFFRETEERMRVLGVLE